jgi:CO/xanthine dehydrogenase Mo-binding subunit
MAGNPSHPSVVTIKTGVTRDGRMVARTLTAIHDSGAYGAMKPVPTVSIGGASHGGGPYRVDNVFFEAIQVYTNTVPRGFFRAPGAPQVNFAVEQHMDLLAEALGMDPAEFRLKNVLQTGDTNPLGHKMRDVQAEPVLRGALEAAKWGTPPGPNRGRGISMYERHILGGQSSAIINAEPDGSLTLVSPTYDQGVGTHVVISQIVAEFLQVPLDTIKVVSSDTDSIPPDGGVGGARGTTGAGNAFFKAAGELLDKLKAAAADRFECPVEEVVSERGELFPREDPRRRLSFAEAIRLAGNGATVNVTTTVNIPLDNSISGFAAQIAEVEVDPETGEFTITHFVSAHDVGQIMNPITHQGQIDGGVVQGIGMGIMEEMPIDEGRVTTLHMGDYKLPTIADIPPLTTVLVPAEEGPAPFAGKAIGEMANVPGPAAIANAVAAACGVRIYDLPVTAEKIYFALHGKAK